MTDLVELEKDLMDAIASASDEASDID
jgi:hypothetical protein